MRGYATKYIDLINRRGEELARRWFQDTRTNSKTLSYHNLPEDTIIPLAANFYQNLGKMLISEKPGDDDLKFFRNYAETTFKRGIPLDEAIYALALMRRHVWLFAEFQDIFMKGADRSQALETLNMTILNFGYIEYEIVKRYQELILADMEKKLGR